VTSSSQIPPVIEEEAKFKNTKLLKKIYGHGFQWVSNPSITVLVRVRRI
jgi:hypothetical protein